MHEDYWHNSWCLVISFLHLGLQIVYCMSLTVPIWNTQGYKYSKIHSLREEFFSWWEQAIHSSTLQASNTSVQLSDQTAPQTPKHSVFSSGPPATSLLSFWHCGCRKVTITSFWYQEHGVSNMILDTFSANCSPLPPFSSVPHCHFHINQICIYFTVSFLSFRSSNITCHLHFLTRRTKHFPCLGHD